MIKYLQLPFYFDAPRMLQEVSLLASERWKLHYQVLYYEGEWTALPFRSVNGEIDNILVSPFADPVYKDTPLLDQCPYIKDILQTFHCPLQGVRLLKLNAGAVIKEHRDPDLYFEKGEIRLHIPVITHELLEFYIEGERLDLKEGECWYMNFNLMHAIKNNSPVDRIHLVIDAKVNDWVKNIFQQPGINKKEFEPPGYDDRTKKLMIERLREMNTETTNRMADELDAGMK